MNTAIANLFILFLATILISIFYWNVVRFTLIQALQFRLFSVRDQLRRLAIEGKVDSKEFSYKYLESLMCKTIAIVPSVSLAAFLFYALRNKNKMSENAVRFEAESPAALTNLKLTTTRYAIFIMMTNSPILFIVSACGAFLFWLLGKISQMSIFSSTELFIGEIPAYPQSEQFA